MKTQNHVKICHTELSKIVKFYKDIQTAILLSTLNSLSHSMSDVMVSCSTSSVRDIRSLQKYLIKCLVGIFHLITAVK